MILGGNDKNEEFSFFGVGLGGWGALVVKLIGVLMFYLILDTL